MPWFDLLLFAIVTTAAAGAGYLREVKYKTNWMLLTIPLPVFILCLAEFAFLRFFKNESEFAFEILAFSFFGSFPLFCAGRELGVLLRTGLSEWYRRRTAEQFVGAFLFAAAFTFIIFIGIEREPKAPHRPLSWETKAWDCKSHNPLSKEFCSKPSSKITKARNLFARAKKSYMAEKYQDCLKHLNGVFEAVPQFENSEELFRFCTYGLKADLQFAHFTHATARSGIEAKHDREYCDGPPMETINTPYCQLNWDEKDAVRLALHSADSEWRRENYHGCRADLNEMRRYVASFAGSEDLEFACGSRKTPEWMARTMKTLNEEEQSAVKDSFNLARNLYVQGKYQLCIQQINNLELYVAQFENSRELKNFCEQGVELVERQTASEAKQSR